MNMHVGSWDPVPRLPSGVVSEVSDEQVELQKPGNRAWILDQLRLVLRMCEEAEDPTDPRVLKLRLETLDRVAKLLRVSEPQRAAERSGDLDRGRLVAQALEALAALER